MIGIRKLRLIGQILILSFLLRPALTAKSNSRDYRARLERLERELRETRMRLQQLRQAEANISEQIRYIEKEETTLVSIISVLDIRQRMLQAEIERYDSIIQRLNLTIDSSLKRISAGLDFLYRRGKQDFWEFVVVGGDQSIGQKVAEQIIDKERLFCEKVMAKRRKLEEYQAKRAKDLAELDSIRANLEARRAELAYLRAQKKQYLAEIRKEKIERQAELQRKEREKRKLERLIAELRSKRARQRAEAGEVVFDRKPSRKGLIWPVKGTVVSKFGIVWNPKYNTKTQNKGIDIKAKPGAGVVASADGEVIFADQFLGYGKMVIIEHEGFLTVYANMVDIFVEVGDKVQRGQTIGTLGFQSPILHFEVRVGGKPVNPLEFLS